MLDELELSMAHSKTITAGSVGVPITRSSIRSPTMNLWRIWLLAPMALIPLLLLIEHFLDSRFSALFYDATQAGFYLRKNWLTHDVIHRFGLYPLGLLVLSFAWLLSQPKLCIRLRLKTSLIGLVLMTILANAAVINLLKRNANTACSWDLHQFGGAYPDSGWFAPLANGLTPGHCWPGAFSLGGFGGLYFVLHELGKPRYANVALLLSLSYGTVLGLTQVARGAHALSHQFWTALICWYVSLLLYCGWRYTNRNPVNQRGLASLYD
jgi:membrane-associated PAP2 superfamily phosphatase